MIDTVKSKIMLNIYVYIYIYNTKVDLRDLY